MFHGLFNNKVLIKTSFCLAILLTAFLGQQVHAENKTKGFCVAKNYSWCNVAPFTMYDTLDEMVAGRWEISQYSGGGYYYVEALLPKSKRLTQQPFPNSG